MSLAINRVTLVGRIATNPEYRITAKGLHLCKFVLAVDRPGKDKGPNWIPVAVFENQAVYLGQFASKGDLLYVEGNLEIRPWKDRGANRTSASVVGRQVNILQQSSKKPTRGPAPSEDDFDPFEDDEEEFDPFAED